jgi:hypothetical protein
MPPMVFYLFYIFTILHNHLHLFLCNSQKCSYQMWQHYKLKVQSVIIHISEGNRRKETYTGKIEWFFSPLNLSTNCWHYPEPDFAPTPTSLNVNILSPISQCIFFYHWISSAQIFSIAGALILTPLHMPPTSHTISSSSEDFAKCEHSFANLAVHILLSPNLLHTNSCKSFLLPVHSF